LENAKHGRNADERDGENIDNDNTESSTDSDSDSDDSFGISIKPVDVSNPSQFNPVPEEERSTHFIAIKITEPEIVENAIRVQQHMVRQEEVILYLLCNVYDNFLCQFWTLLRRILFMWHNDTLLKSNHSDQIKFEHFWREYLFWGQFDLKPKTKHYNQF